MQIRTKFKLLVGMWLISGSILLLGAMYLTPYFLIPLFVVFGLIGFYSMSLRCPNCRKPVLFNPIKIFGKEIFIWTSWIPKKCTKCGIDLKV